MGAGRFCGVQHAGTVASSTTLGRQSCSPNRPPTSMTGSQMQPTRSGKPRSTDGQCLAPCGWIHVCTVLGVRTSVERCIVRLLFGVTSLTGPGPASAPAPHASGGPGWFFILMAVILFAVGLLAIFRPKPRCSGSVEAASSDVRTSGSTPTRTVLNEAQRVWSSSAESVASFWSYRWVWPYRASVAFS